MRTLIITGIVFFLGCIISYSQDDGDKSGSSGPSISRTINLVKVTDNIYMFKGKGGNIGVITGEDGVLMIDNQFAETTPEILNITKSLSDKPIQFLVNTHHHGDHTGGNVNMINNGTIIYAHDNVRRHLLEGERSKFAKEQETAFNKNLEKLAKNGNKEKAEAKAKEDIRNMGDFTPSANTYPAITFSDNMTFYYNGEKIMVFHVQNAHTDGDVMVYFTKSNVLHMGDVFFNGRYPFVDLNSGGNYNGYIKALSRALILIDEETKIIPGHGDLATKSDVKYSHDMMVALKNSVAYEYVSGKTKEQIIANKDLTKIYDAKGFGDGFISTEKFVGLIYDITKKQYGKLIPRKN
ncbi:MAG: MBL fold metallo-hydrolase [Bacteroidetes bacterium]|nr:MBL fold metallo-hydrolase [Bacteroidota bacterium]